MASQVDDPDDGRRDEELRASTVGMLEPHNAPITLVAYDPDWPRLFGREAERLRSVLGDVALRIEHVGSTSVPGLTAKPIVDVLLVVPDSADEPCYLPRLQAAGYVLRIREPDWFEHRLVKGPDTDVNLHVFSAGAAEVERMLRFRDRLRADDAARNATRAPSASSPGGPGGTCRTTPTPRPPWSGRSSAMRTAHPPRVISRRGRSRTVPDRLGRRRPPLRARPRTRPAAARRSAGSARGARSARRPRLRRACLASDLAQPSVPVAAVSRSAYRRWASSSARVASRRPSQPRLSADLPGSRAS